MTDARSIKARMVAAGLNKAHLSEAVPREYPGVPSGRLEALHAFARASPIYSDSFGADLGVPCTVYEGDISGYWIDSIKHDASAQPFYPTWLLSACLAASEAARLGARECVDVGSGDGRVAYACASAGLESHGLELDPGLCALQKLVSRETGVRFDPRCADAALFDYSSLNLSRPAVFVGGLPQMGELLAGSVVEALKRLSLQTKPLFVLPGSAERRKMRSADSAYGWGPLLEKAGLSVESTLMLPTSWTMDRADDTPYVYAR